MGDTVKAEKLLMKKKKLDIATDNDKAYTSEMVALKAKEKIAKSTRANSKVTIFNTEAEMKQVKTDDDRRAAEQKIADARGDMFKADKDNDDYTHKLLETAKKLASTKELLHKSKASIQKKKETQEVPSSDCLEVVIGGEVLEEVTLLLHDAVELVDVDLAIAITVGLVDHVLELLIV